MYLNVEFTEVKRGIRAEMFVGRVADKGWESAERVGVRPWDREYLSSKDHFPSGRTTVKCRGGQAEESKRSDGKRRQAQGLSSALGMWDPSRLGPWRERGAVSRRRFSLHPSSGHRTQIPTGRWTRAAMTRVRGEDKGDGGRWCWSQGNQGAEEASVSSTITEKLAVERRGELGGGSSTH